MKSLLSSLLFLAIGAVLWLMLSTQRETLLDVDTRSVTGIDAYMKAFTMTAMNERGMPAVRLTAVSLQHAVGSEVAELDAPDIHIIDEARQRWRITAARGTIDNARQIVELSAGVDITRLDTASPLVISTDNLIIEIDSQRMHTQAAVRLTTGDARLRADGMMIDNLDGRLELLAAVRGDYVLD